MQNVEISNSPRLLKVAELAELLNKHTPLEATQENEHEATKDRDELTQDSSTSQQQPSLDHRIEQTPTHPDPTPTKAGELEIEVSEIEFGVLIL